MKSFKHFLPLLAISLYFTSCAPQGLVLDSSYDYNGKFTTYRTFRFLDQKSEEQGQDLDIIQNTIYKRMTGLGYKYDPNSPDLYISYRYFDQPVKITGMTQTDLQSWIQKSEYVDDKTEVLRSSDCHQRKISLPAGSFVVNFIDTKQQKVIWQGHFGQHIPWSHPRELEASIMLVMDKYKVTAYN